MDTGEAWYLALTGTPMFPEPLEAWDDGPVVYDLSTTYRMFEGERAILEPTRGDSQVLDSVALIILSSFRQKSSTTEPSDDLPAAVFNQAASA